MNAPTLIRTSPPSGGAFLVSLDEAKAQCRVDHSDDDDYLRAIVEASYQALDGWDGWLGRALLTQSWEMRLDAFDCTPMRIPLPPLISLDSIKYVDANGTVQTISAPAYEIVPGGTWHARLRPVYGTSWPSPRCEEGCVRIGFTAGYGDPLKVPAPIRQAILLNIAWLYENREADMTELSLAAQNLLSPYRVTW